MARGDIGFYKTNSNSIPAVVLDEWNADGTAATGDAADDGSVDVLLLGVDQGKRYNVPIATSEAAALPNEFARTPAAAG